MSIDSFQTERLHAERMTPDHFDLVCRLHRDPEVMRTLSADGEILSDDVTWRWLLQATEHWERQGFGFWVFHERASGRFVGRGGLKVYRIDNQNETGLAYAVVSEFWGRGFATEMSEGSLGTGFERLGFPEIGSWTLPVNRASQRVMEKLGFRYVRDFEFAGLKHRYYRLLASDWRGRSGDADSALP
jgi:RimJ/RimL family protein N-acetyltransferase